MSRLSKKEGGIEYPERCFLDRRDPKKPSTWGLRTHELVHGKLEITREQLNKATAALFSPGYMGNRNISQNPGSSFETLRRDLLSKYREIGVPDSSIPKGLLPKGHVATSTKFQKDFIAMEGVKGMKWGIRKDRTSSSTEVGREVSKMSDQELRTKLNRLQMERNYKDLVSKKNAESQTRFDRGLSVVQKQMKAAGEEQLKNVFSKTLKFGISKGLEKAAGENPSLRTLADMLK